MDDGAAAGVGELVGGVDAPCGDSDILGEFDETLCGTRKSRRSGAVGLGADPAPRRCGSMRTMSSAPLLSVTVVTSRFSGAGVHNPDVVSIGELSGGSGR